jgi:hypothetical protein
MYHLNPIPRCHTPPHNSLLTQACHIIQHRNTLNHILNILNKSTTISTHPLCLPMSPLIHNTIPSTPLWISVSISHYLYTLLNCVTTNQWEPHKIDEGNGIVEMQRREEGGTQWNIAFDIVCWTCLFTDRHPQATVVLISLHTQSLLMTRCLKEAIMGITSSPWLLSFE